MAHFAKIENSVVANVIVVNNTVLQDDDGVEVESLGIAFCKKLFGDDTEWVQTSYNNNFRKRYAGIGYTYDSEKDMFIPPKPYDSWALDSDGDWQAPVAKPDDYEDEDKRLRYVWSEDDQAWILLPE